MLGYYFRIHPFHGDIERKFGDLLSSIWSSKYPQKNSLSIHALSEYVENQFDYNKVAIVATISHFSDSKEEL